MSISQENGDFATEKKLLLLKVCMTPLFIHNSSDSLAA